MWVCVLARGLRLQPATPGWGFFVCVCLCARSVCTTPLVAWVCGVGVFAWAWVSAAPRNSGLGCWGVCVFVCMLGLYPATPGRGVRCGCVCVGSGFGCVSPVLAGVLACVCVCVRFRLYPAIHGWGVGCGCLCLGSRLNCAPPLLPGVLGCVCVCVRTLLVPRHSWPGCAVWLCVRGLAFRLRTVTPGWGVGVWVCLCARCACTPPLLAGVCGVCVCVFGLGFRLCPATPGWGVWVCVCLCARSTCSPPLQAGVLGCVCVSVRAPLVPRHSWLGAVCVCVWIRVLAAPLHSTLMCWGVRVFVCALRLYPASPGWVGQCGCVCLGSGFGCASPLLAWVLGFGCVCLRAPPVLRHSGLGCAAWLCPLGPGFGLRPATPGWGMWFVGQMLPGTCSFAVVRCGLCVMPGSAAPGGRSCLAPVLVPWLWPAAYLSCVPRGPALVRRALSGPVALGAPVAFPDALVPFCTPGACAPGFNGRLRGTCGGRPRTGLFVPAPGRCRGSCLARSALYQFGAPRRGCPWQVPQASVSGCVRCGGWLVWTRPLTRLVSRTARLSTGDSAGAPGLFRVDADTALFGSEDTTPGSRACVYVCVLIWAGTGAPAFRARFGAPHLFFRPVSMCSLSAKPPPGWGCPVVVAVFSLFSLPRPRCLWLPVFASPRCLGPLRLLVLPHRPPSFVCFFFFFSFVRLRCLWRSVFSGPWCLGPWRLVVLPSAPLFCFYFSSPAPLHLLFFFRCLSLFFSLFFSSFFSLFFFPWCAGWVVLGLVCASWAVG